MRLLFLVFLALSCSSDGGNEPSQDPDPNSDPISTEPDSELSSGDCTYVLDHKITVDTRIENTESDCDCLVVGGITIENGTLTIDPGVTMRFEQDTGLFVTNQGNIHAVGTADQRISFEGGQKIQGYARGIYFNGPDVPSTFDYTDFKYLGKQDVAIDNRNAAIAGSSSSAPVTLKNSTVMGSDYHGASFAGLPLGGFENNAFFSNDRYGLVVNTEYLRMLDDASDYLGANAPNGEPYIATSALFTKVTTDATWRNVGAPYRAGTIYVERGDITIEAGTTFVFGDGGQIKIERDATLSVEGTAEDPVNFIAEEGTTSYWDGIWFVDTDKLRNKIEYALIDRAGKNGNAVRGALSLWGPANLRLSHTTISNSESWGICLGYLSNTSTFEQGEGNVFENNPEGDVVENCNYLN